MRRSSLPVFLFTWFSFNVHARDTCAQTCAKGSAQYNYGCEKPSYECLCNSRAGLETLAICISNCPDPYESWGSALKIACKSKDGSKTVLDLYMLYSDAIESAIDHSDIPASNITFLPVRRDKESFDKLYLAYEVLEYHANIDFKHSTSIYLYWASVIGLGIVSNVFQHLPDRITKPILNLALVRRIRGLVLIPATAGKRHCRPVKLFGFIIGQIPTRCESLVIFGEILLLVVLQTTYYHFYLPNPILENKRIQLMLYLGRRSGRLCVAHLPFLFMFAFRSNVLRSATGWSISTFHVFHRAIGRMMMTELLIHTITFSVYEMNKHRNFNIWKIDSLYWGLVGTCAAGAIVVTSFRALRDRFYEVFLLIHTILAIAFVVGTWYHLYILEAYQVMMTIIALWVFEHAMRLLRVLYYGLSAKCKALLHEDGIVELRVYPLRKFSLHPGEYAFIHFLKFNVWESHPLSVMEYDDETGEMTLFTKPKEGMTLKLFRHLQTIDKGSASSLNVWIDGPYGKHIMGYKFRDVLYIAGGVGITAVAASAVEVATKYTGKNVCLHWVIKNDASLNWGKRYLDKINDAGHRVKVHITGDEVKDTTCGNVEDSGTCRCCIGEPKPYEITAVSKGISDELRVECGARPDIDHLIREMIDECKDAAGNTDMAVVVSGPANMNDDARKSVAHLVQSVPGRLEYVEEAFAW